MESPLFILGDRKAHLASQLKSDVMFTSVTGSPVRVKVMKRGGDATNWYRVQNGEGCCRLASSEA